MSGGPLLESGGFAFSVAGPADEPEVRALVGRTPMPGALSVRFEREPDYFLGCDVMGDRCQVLIAREQATGELAGVACRAELPAHVNGARTRLAALGGVRIAPAFRGRHLLELGLPLLEHGGLVHVGVIARDNPRAVRAMIRRPPGGAAVARVGGLTTLGLMVHHRGHPHRVPRGVRVVRADDSMLPDVVAFLDHEGIRHQFGPARAAADFGGGRRMRGLAARDIHVAVRGGRVVGCLACWDQRGFKQDVVDSYGPGLRRARPVLDLAAHALGAAGLPAPGGRIEAAFGALPMVAGDDPEVFNALLDAALADAHERGVAWLMIGLADDDPLLRVARRRLHVAYHASIHALSWAPDRAARLAALDGRCPYVEVAAL